MNCTICQGPMDAGFAEFGAHPNCIPFADLDGPDSDPLANEIKRGLIGVIKWADRQNPRSLQKEIGPSEIGNPCERRVGYRLAQIPAVNTESDPWPAIVGTAIHSWLETSMIEWNRVHEGSAWIPETPVVLSGFVRGRSDLYHDGWNCVIDYKGAGPTVMEKVTKEGPPPGYVAQVHCYGYGYEQLGKPVQNVALVFLPRAGWLRDMYVWTAPYDRQVALDALTRLERLAGQVIELEILTNPHRWEQLDAVASNSCAFCPWYSPDRDSDRGADDKGCPGR